MSEKVRNLQMIQQDENESNCNKEKILIASLGAMPYQETTYVFEPEKILKKTRYAFHAVCEIEKPNKLMLVGTRDSFWHELVDYFKEHGKTIFTDQETVNVCEFVKREKEPRLKAESVLRNKHYAPLFERDDEYKSTAIECIIHAAGFKWLNGTQPGSNYEIVESFLEKALNLEKVKIVIVPEGIDNSQQEEYFNLLRDGLSELISNSGDKPTEILFDVTYGFRSMPLYIMMLIRYFDLLKEHNFVFKAYYGVFEARDRDNNTTPLVDLTIVPIMTDWINAIHDFIEYGSVKTLIKCLKMEKDGKPDNISSYIDEVTKEFGTFEYAMNANNLYYLVRGIVYITGLKYLSIENVDYDILDVNHPVFSPQAKMMLENIRQKYCERFSTKAMEETGWNTTESYVLAQIARLYTSQGNYGDAAIAFQEGVLTYVMERFLRETIMMEECLSSTDQFYSFVHVFSNRDEKKKTYDAHLNTLYQKKKLKGFDKIYYDIKDKIRNTQAHFKYEKNESVAISQMENWLEEGIKMLLNEMESGYGTDFINLTGLRDIYPDKSRQKIIQESRTMLFERILKSIPSEKYEFSDNVSELVQDQEMQKVLRILNMSDSVLLQWVEDLTNYCRDGGEPSVLVESTYVRWVNGRISRAKRKSKDPDIFTPSLVDTSLIAYLTALHQVRKDQIAVVDSIAATATYKK